MDKQVVVYGSTPLVGSFSVAKGLDRSHQIVLELIEKYKEDFEDFSSLKREKLRSTGGRSANEYLLDEDQFMFLGTLMRNSRKTVDFKKAIIKQFRDCRRRVEELEKHKQEPEYQITRDVGKIVRKETTDVIKEFVEYAESQGSKSPNMYYSNISAMLNRLLFIVEGKHKNLRELMTTKQLMTCSSADQIIERGLKDGMSRKRFYKDIFQDVKKNVDTFSDLHGKSEVIDKSLIVM